MLHNACKQVIVQQLRIIYITRYTQMNFLYIQSSHFSSFDYYFVYMHNQDAKREPEM